MYAALEDVTRFENTVKNLIAKDQSASLWSDSIVPTDSVDLSVPQIALPDALKTALDNRPELQQSEVLREINQIDQRYYKDQTKPAIDVIGTYGSTGLAGSVATSGNPFSVSSELVRERVDQLSTLPVYSPANYTANYLFT